jgi:hypothetical protein
MSRKPGLFLLAVAVIGSLLLAGCGGSSHSPTVTHPPAARAIAPVLLNGAGLKTEAHQIRQPIYWAGPMKGYRSEFQRTSQGYVYVRYLPQGVRTGAPGRNFLVVATYIFYGAFHGLKTVANGKGVAGPGGSLVYVNPRDPRSVLMAFPGVDYEIEVYDPKPAVARSTALSGRVKPVLG